MNPTQGEPCHGAKVTAEAVKALDDTGIASVLFGWKLMHVHKQQAKYDEIDLVIPDKKIEAATKALVDKGYRLCGDSECWKRQRTLYNYSMDKLAPRAALDQMYPVKDAAVHLHYEKYHSLSLSWGRRGDHQRLIALWPQSKILFWLPEIQMGPPPMDDPHFILTTDRDRVPAREEYGPSGPWTYLHPVKMPRMSCFVEALLILTCRDMRRDYSLCSFWVHLASWIPDFGEIESTLKPEFRAAWSALKTDQDIESPFYPLVVLRQRLMTIGQLPLPLPSIDVDTFRGSKSPPNLRRAD